LPSGASSTKPAPELCVVVPVLNEAGNVAELVERLKRTLAGIDWELVFVDDGSADATRDVIAGIGSLDARIRLVHRIGRRGLASAFIEGAQSSLARYVAVMDGDLQHDESLLPRMLELLRAGSFDVVVGSRYVAGGGLGAWSAGRARLSSIATRLSRTMVRADIADPMSGFFMLPRSVLNQALPRVSAVGFKILLDVLASLPVAPRVKELGFQFRTRTAGESKLDTGVAFDFLLLLLDKMAGGLVPVRFIVFAAIGLLGVVAHLLVLRAGLGIGLQFEAAQAVATFTAIIGNFVLNNVLTFRDRRLRGRRAIRGVILFTIACGVGALANLNVTALMVDSGHQTWLVAGLIGAAMSLVWNYAVGSTVTWRRR
jgi:dolichol-phosphate mannosyltransferase